MPGRLWMKSAAWVALTGSDGLAYPLRVIESAFCKESGCVSFYCGTGGILFFYYISETSQRTPDPGLRRAEHESKDGLEKDPESQ